MAGRPTVDLDAIKPEIVQMFHEGRPYASIASDIGVSERTIRRRIQSWGLRKKAQFVKVDDNTGLRSQVAILWTNNLTDDEIVIALRSQGWCVQKRTVQRIWKSQGLLRRMSVFQRQQAIKQLWDVIKMELDNGTIKGFRKGSLYIYFKRLGHQIPRYIYIYLILYLYSSLMSI